MGCYRYENTTGGWEPNLDYCVFFIQPQFLVDYTTWGHRLPSAYYANNPKASYQTGVTLGARKKVRTFTSGDVYQFEKGMGSLDDESSSDKIYLVFHPGSGYMLWRGLPPSGRGFKVVACTNPARPLPRNLVTKDQPGVKDFLTALGCCGIAAALLGRI